MNASPKTLARARSLIASGWQPENAVRKALAEQTERVAAKPKRPSYREAIAWLVGNDDTEWAKVEEGDDYFEAKSSPAVTACLIADLFGVDTDRIRADVRKGLKAAGKLS